MSSRVFWKIFVPFVILNVACIVCVMMLERNGFSTKSIVAFGGIYLLACFGFARHVVSRIARPIDTLVTASRRMTRGRYETPVYLGSRDEFGELATSLNLLREEMVLKTTEMDRLSTVLAAIKDGVIAIDEMQCVQYANEPAGRMLGFSPQAAQGRPLLESVRSHRLDEMVTRLFASKLQDELELEWGDEDPSSLFISATFFADEPSSGIIMMISNLSEIHHLQTMRRDFVANVSHELKTPLSSIKAYAETLRNGAMDDENNRDRFVAIIEEQADRLNQLISDLLSLARIEQGRALMEIQAVPVHRMVEVCIHEQQRAAGKKNIELICAVGDEPVFANADEDGLRQILVNLIDNAIKYTPNGGTVTVGCEVVDSGIQVFVADTGLGIPAEMQDRVFERFFRVDKARSRELGGTGLGLAIVKHLAQSFGGSVEVTSEQGRGSRFTVQLPHPE